METAAPGSAASTRADVASQAAERIADEIARLDPPTGASRLAELDDGLAVEALWRMNPQHVGELIPEMDEAQRRRLFSAGPEAVTSQWALNQGFPEGSVGRLMEPPTAVFKPEQSVGDVTAKIRQLVKKIFITYVFVIDENAKLVGIVTMRDLLVSDPALRLEEVMLRKPFFLWANVDIMEAMKLVVHRHFPVYPVCDAGGRLVGLVRGQALFEAQAFVISAQAGRMVGVAKEERFSTPWLTSLKLRHPWLQLNLLTAFVAAAVVGIFQNTLDQMVILALFLPVLAGQSGNTGCQALAVTLRGMTLGDLEKGAEKGLVVKEMRLGLLNGTLVGITAGLGMYLVANAQDNPQALQLGGIVMCAMIGSCVVSGLSGALIPLTLQRIGADPATASSIFLTTATDVASMGMFLGLASLLLI
jgi:magnesium transporter